MMMTCWLGHSAIGFIVERYGEQKMLQFVAEQTTAAGRSAR